MAEYTTLDNLKAREDFRAEKDATVGGDLSVAGTAEITGNTSVTGNFEVSGTITQTGFKQVYVKKCGTITHEAESGAGVAMGSLPAGALLTRIYCDVTTLFDGDAPTLDFGVGTAAGVSEAYMANSDITAGTAGVYSKSVSVKAAEAISLYAELNETTTTAGSATFYIEYIML